MRQLKINWRVGTTNVFESIWNLRRKFSYLNKVGVGDTNEVLRLANGSVDGVIDLANPALKWLGEPLKVIRDCSLENFLLPKAISGIDRKFTVKELHYCSACISRGYHSPIHQLPWVALCPIHLLPLNRRCDRCGNAISTRAWEKGKPYSSSKNIDIEACHCNLWPGMESHQWPRGYCVQETPRIVAYLRWLQALQYAPEIRSAQSALTMLRLRSCTSNSHDELFQMWRQLVSPPKSVEEFLIESSISPPVVEKVIFASDARAEAVLRLVEQSGYDPFESGVVQQCARVGEKGEWEYFAKRICKKLSKHRHSNCHQVLQRNVQKRYLKGMVIDVVRFLKTRCPRSELLRMIRSASLSCDAKYWPAIVDSYDYSSFLSSWIDQELVSAGLARIDVINKEIKLDLGKVTNEFRGGVASVVWTDEVRRFSAIFVKESHAAVISYLIYKYCSIFRHRRTVAEDFECFLDAKSIKWPYILVSVVEQCVLRLTIWRRHDRINNYSIEQIDDNYSSDIKELVRRENRLAIEERKRELSARWSEVSKLRYPSFQEKLSSGGIMSNEAGQGSMLDFRSSAKTAVGLMRSIGQ